MSLNIYQCLNCPKSFARKRAFTIHCSTHSDERQFHCHLCNYSAKSPKTLKNHIRFVHSTMKPFQCDICQRCFKTVEVLTRHGQIHIDKSLRQIFGCDYCEKTFLSADSRITHVRRRHTLTTTKFSCEFCQKEFLTMSRKDDHLRVVHLREVTHHCPHPGCSISCRDRHAFQRHLETHLPVQERASFPCPHCPRKYLSLRNVQRHVDIAHLHKYKCTKDGCVKLFDSAAHLESHITTHGTPIIWKCDVCQKSFNHRSNLLCHKKTIHSEGNLHKKLECSVCTKRFHRKSKLMRHEQTHLDNEKRRKFECDQCPNVYLHEEGLKDHTGRCHGKDDAALHFCDYANCDKCYMTKKGLTAHVKQAHTIARVTFGCYFCDKLCPNIGNLNNHMRIHTDEKPYQCGECYASFRCDGNIRSHMITRHTKDAEREKYPCPHCDRVYIVQDSLTAHVRSVHEGVVNKIACNICGKLLSNKYYLEDHIRTRHTKETPFSCPHCDYKTATRYNYRRHIVRHKD